MRILALALLAALLPTCAVGTASAASAAGGGQSVRLFAVNVGKGDALIVQVDGWTGLIDAGKAYARGLVVSALATLGVSALDAVFVTHVDDDHTEGLEWLAQSDIPVGAWYASAMYTGVKDKKHPVAKAAAARGASVQWLSRGDRVTLGDTGAALEVLAPAELFQDDDDNNSLVMRLDTAQGRMLLTGDMELPEEASLLGRGDDLACAVLKAPNHGDDDTLTDAFIRAVSPQIAVISTDGQQKPGTPDPRVLSRLRSAGATCLVTEDAGLGIAVTLSGGAARAEYVDIDAAPAKGVYIESVIPGEDLVILENDGEDCDLSGWYLHSDRGDELYVFPDGCVLQADGTLTVGTKSSKSGNWQLLWDDKKVIHKSKTDNIELYDAWGRLVDSRDNGL